MSDEWKILDELVVKQRELGSENMPNLEYVLVSAYHLNLYGVGEAATELARLRAIEAAALRYMDDAKKDSDVVDILGSFNALAAALKESESK